MNRVNFIFLTSQYLYSAKVSSTFFLICFHMGFIPSPSLSLQNTCIYGSGYNYILVFWKLNKKKMVLVFCNKNMKYACASASWYLAYNRFYHIHNYVYILNVCNYRITMYWYLRYPKERDAASNNKNILASIRFKLVCIWNSPEEFFVFSFKWPLWPTE